MKYLRLFENFQDIDSLCEEYEIENYTINDDGFVDVDDSVSLSVKILNKLPIKFGKVRGGFDCFFNSLTSLEGFPKEVGGNFDCSGNLLTSLDGCPKEVSGYFDCSWNKLTSLKGCPDKVGGNFDCAGNELTSLEGCPQRVGGNFDCSDNQLTIIDYLPEWIEGDIELGNNKIRDIKVEDKNWRFYGKCNLEENPINDLFQYWEGNLKSFILDLDLEDFIRDDGKSLDITRFEYALNGKEYKEEDIKKNYNLIYRKVKPYKNYKIRLPK